MIIYYTVQNTGGLYSCDKKSKNNKTIFIFLSKQEVTIIKDRNKTFKNDVVYNSIKNKIYETIDHELSHLSEYSQVKRKTIRNELSKKFDLTDFSSNDGYVNDFLSNVIGSDEYFEACFEIDNYNDALSKTLMFKINNLLDNCITNSEISAKLTGLKALSVRKNTNLIDEIVKYLIEMIAVDRRVADYNNLLKINAVKKFYKKLILTILNYFIESALLKYPVIDKKFDKVQIFDSTYIYNKNSKKFE